MSACLSVCVSVKKIWEKIPVCLSPIRKDTWSVCHLFGLSDVPDMYLNIFTQTRLTVTYVPTLHCTVWLCVCSLFIMPCLLWGTLRPPTPPSTNVKQDRLTTYFINNMCTFLYGMLSYYVSMDWTGISRRASRSAAEASCDYNRTVIFDHLQLHCSISVKVEVLYIRPTLTAH